MSKKLTLAQRVGSFKAYVQDMTRSWYQIWDVDGEYRYWNDLSNEGKLEAVIRAAAHDDVPFDLLAETVQSTLGDLPPGVVEQAALSVALRLDKELHAIAKVLPKWWEYDHEGSPLRERVKEVVDSYLKDSREWAKKDRKVSLANLKAEGPQEQPGRQKTRDKGMER